MPIIIALVVVAVLLALYFLVAIGGVLLFFLPWILVGLISGWIASKVMNSEHGLLGDTLIGMAGSFIGGVLYAVLTHQRAGRPLSLVHILVSIAGSIILLAIIKAVRGPSQPVQPMSTM